MLGLYLELCCPLPSTMYYLLFLYLTQQVLVCNRGLMDGVFNDFLYGLKKIKIDKGCQSCKNA